MVNQITIFWFRRDLRISDNSGLLAALQNGLVMPIYILDNNDSNPFKIGGASKWWLHHSLNNLNKLLDNKLNVYLGDPKTIILKLTKKHQASSVYWNRCYDPYSIKTDTTIKSTLHNMNIDCKSFNASLLWEPWDPLKPDGTPYKVYTYFYRNGCLKSSAPRKPLPKPKKLTLFLDPNNACSIDQLQLLSKIKWYNKIEPLWEIGEQAAKKKLTIFLNKHLNGYKDNRNYPDKPNVSRLSPHLSFGEISPHQIWHAALDQQKLDKDLEHFLSEIAWREFSYYLLYHFPELPHKNFQSKFDQFIWEDNQKFLIAWQQGQTGYPIVDAGMRELWQTGYMHNRVRMIVGSFLVKNLLLHWRHGENWFWECLLDADLANNSASWQWIAGCGADAAPYFRIFNPVTQGEKFDQDGNYTKKFVPELANLPNKYLFKPWEAPEAILKNAGVVLGKTYPNPIVDLKLSRNKAIEAYRNISVTNTNSTL